MLITFIYALIDPRTDAVRYVGKSDKPRTRLRQHIRAASGGANSRLYQWIRELLAAGLEPHMEILEEVSVNEWPDAERHWMEVYHGRGCQLLNATLIGTPRELDMETAIVQFLRNRGYRVEVSHAA